MTVPFGSTTTDEDDHSGTGKRAADRDVVVSAQNLVKTYRTGRNKQAWVRALDGVDVEVRTGNLLVLLGPSGCGKTTLLRAIAGLEHPDEGDIQIAGTTVFSSRTHVIRGPEKRNIGMMFQSYALWPHMTVLSNVIYPLRNQHGVSKADAIARAQALLESLGVAGMDSRHPSELSGGQQQRVALSRSLIGEPSVLLFDEPLSNVDARVRRKLRAQLRDLLKRTGFAGIYVTHDQEEAMELADVLAVMDNGRILQIGPPREIYSRPINKFVADFIGDANILDATVIEANSGRLTAETQFGTFFATPSDEAVAPQPGVRGHIFFRPHTVHVAPAGSASSRADVDSFEARVTDVVFLGARAEVRAEYEPGREIVASVPESEAEHLQRGVMARLSVGHHDTRWLTS